MTLRTQLSRLAITVISRVIRQTEPPEEIFDFIVTQSGVAITTQSDLKIQVEKL